MVKKGTLTIAMGAVVLMAMGAGLAIAKKAPAPSGNLNLRINGTELLTPGVSSPVRLVIDGIGQVIGDSTGTLSGAETYTALVTSSNSVEPAEQICNGTVSGSITPPAGDFASGTGEFTASLTFTPVADSGSYCIPATTTFECSRALFHEELVNDLDAGEYACVATGSTAAAGADTTVDGVSLSVNITSVRGANAPTS
jgi:hypothetical protein